MNISLIVVVLHCSVAFSVSCDNYLFLVYISLLLLASILLFYSLLYKHVLTIFQAITKETHLGLNLVLPIGLYQLLPGLNSYLGIYLYDSLGIEQERLLSLFEWWSVLM